MVIVLSPRREAASIWFRMSAKIGEIRSVGPSPRRRSRLVARKYTALLPHPIL